MEPPRPTNPYAPEVADLFGEKVNFAGVVISAMAYGVVVILFFRCLGALLDPVKREEGGIKWPLAIHTVVMFSLVTVFTAQCLWVHSLSYVDDRGSSSPSAFAFKSGPPGPLTGQYIIPGEDVGPVPAVLIYVNTLLADSLLLYRCYVTYARNNWVIALPFLMYLASIAMSIVYAYQMFKQGSYYTDFAPFFSFGTPFYSISLSLCVLLMLMIVARFALHSRDIQNEMGSLGGGSELYRAICTIFIESYAVYVITFALFLGTWAANSYLLFFFFKILAETQAIAPFLVIIQVDNRTALTKEAVVSGDISSVDSESREGPTGYTGTLLKSSTEMPSRESSGGLGVGAEMNIDEVLLTDLR